ncbi:MAG: glycoside hydrolase superfamily [Linnemannia gamsii]|nr:MAG: glycoside hydrolase superfamily [Linnemannia gamsii]
MTTRTSTLRKVLWVAATLVVLTVAGIVVYKNPQGNNNNGGNGGRGGGTSAGLGDGTAGQGNTIIGPNGNVLPNDPHKLKRVFYGMAYVPLNAQVPNCYNTQQTIDDELQLLVQATKRVRLYGTDCNVLRYTIDAIQRLKLDLQVVVGIWIDKDMTVYTRQAEEFYAVMDRYGWSNVIGVSVGNEVLFDKYQPPEVLVSLIAEVKSKMAAFGHSDIPVFTSDLESANRPPLTDHEDKAGVNLHPFFSGIPIDQAASWYWKYLNETVTPAVNSGTKKTDIWITEVGWPTFPATAAVEGSVPSIPNLQTFVDTWLCEANKKGTPYYFFEFFDAPWKIRTGSAVEGFWGLLTIDKRLKVELPDCLAI